MLQPRLLCDRGHTYAFKVCILLAMADTTDPEVERLLVALEDAGVRAECPMCGHAGWFVAPHLLAVSFAQANGDAIATVALSCTNCGFVRQHAPQLLDQHMDPRGE
jgi:predicted RNA-binding Zn-ribbon protein involved in translation (DUF1610 family)